MSDTTALRSPTLEAPGMWRRSGLLIGLVAALLSAALGWMVWDRISLLKSGREIVLPVVPVDPRSLFRGDYVILGYAITQVPAPAVVAGVSPNDGRRYGARPLYVTLEQDANGGWKAIATAPDHPGAVPANQVVLQGRPDRWFWTNRTTGSVRVRYGIESYFVPEGKGLELERLVRDKKIAARVAVDRKGRAAIKGLLVDGQPVYAEPLL